MKKKLASAILAAAFILPFVPQHVKADEERNESAASEKKESAETQRREESRALTRYNKAVAAHGKESPQAKAAWKRYAHEMKEHGHESEIQNNANAPTTPNK